MSNRSLIRGYYTLVRLELGCMGNTESAPWLSHQKDASEKVLRTLGTMDLWGRTTRRSTVESLVSSLSPVFIVGGRILIQRALLSSLMLIARASNGERKSENIIQWKPAVLIWSSAGSKVFLTYLKCFNFCSSITVKHTGMTWLYKSGLNLQRISKRNICMSVHYKNIRSQSIEINRRYIHFLRYDHK